MGWAVQARRLYSGLAPGRERRRATAEALVYSPPRKSKGLAALGNFLDFLADHYVLSSAAVLLAIAIALVEAKRAFKPWRDVGPFELTQLVNSGAVLVDVRSDKSFRDGHIAGARRCDLADVEATLATSKSGAAKDDAVVLYCESGSASDKAAEKLALAGYRKVATLRGGIATWRTENLPLARA